MSTETQLAQLLQHGVNLERRVLYLGADVDAQSAIKFIAAIELLDSTPGDIRIVMTCEGGEVPHGYAMYNAITMCRNKVIMEGYGAVWSIAAAIFQAGDLRRLAPNATYMIHNGTAPTEEEMKQDSIFDLAEQLKKENQIYYDILSHASQQPQDIIEAWCRDEKYFSAEEAVQAGFADEIIEPLKLKGPPIKKKRRKKP